MTSSGGNWVRVRFADATSRLDWVPAEQPPAPDDRPGAWHVVPDPAGGASRWEWHPGSSARPASPGDAPGDPHGPEPLPRQVVPNRPPRGTPPSVFPTTEARPLFPLRTRWAAWSLSVVLAVPVIYLLARPSEDGEASRTAAQSAVGTTDGGDSLADDEAATTTGDVAETDDDADTDAEATDADATDAEATERYLTYLADLDSAQGYSFAALGPEYLTSTGAESCAALDRGSGYELVRQSVMARIPNGGQLLVAAAATYLCPRHHAKLQSFTTALSP